MLRLPLRIAICLLFLAALPLGAEPAATAVVAWGPAVGGLQVGITCATLETPADHPPVFAVHLRNVGQHTLTLPTIASFVARKHPGARQASSHPLAPHIERITGREVQWVTTSGVPRRKIGQAAFLLRPGETLEIPQVRLEQQWDGPDFGGYGECAVRTLWWLQPESTYRIAFSFANEQAEVDGHKAWVGEASSAPLEVRVTPPSLAGLELVGSFTLPKERYFLGEPIRATFRVANRGERSFSLETVNGGTFPYQMSIKAVGEDGKTVPDPNRSRGIGEGIGGQTNPFKRGDAYTETVLLNAWCAFTQPGRYTITLKRILPLHTESPRRASAGRTPQSPVPVDPPVLDGVWSSLPDSVRPTFTFETKLSVTLYRDDEALARQAEALAASVERGADNNVRETLRALAQAGVEPAFAPIARLAHQTMRERREVVRWLGYYGKEKAGPVLAELARDPDPAIRTEALRVLSSWDTPAPADLVRRALLSTDTGERRAAVLLCGQGKHPECLPVLLEMAGDPDDIVRRYLGYALGAYGDPRAIPPLLKLLSDPSPDRFIRIWAAQGLGKLGRKDGVPVLIALLREEETRDYRGNITHALTGITGKDFGTDADAWVGLLK